MKILYLNITNFMAIGQADIALNDKGLVLVQGQNLDDSSADSNGAGKTTLLDALCWCLYGSTSSGHKADAVVNRTAGKNCCVQVKIDDDGQRYTIARHRKHKEHKNRLKVFSEDGEITKGTDALTDKLVEKLIGSSRSVFLSSVYASQENFISLPDLSDRHLKELVEEAAGITRLTLAYDEACKRLNSHKAKHDLLDSSLAPLTTLEATLESDITSLEASIEVWDETQIGLIEETKAEIDEYSSKHAALIEQVGKLPDVAVINAKILELDDQLASKATFDDAVQQAQRKVDKTQRDQQVHIDQAKSLKAKYLRAKDAAEQVSKQVGKPCSECGKPYEECDLAHVRNAKLATCDELATQAIAEKKSADALGPVITALMADLYKATDAVPDLSVVMEKRDKCQGLIKQSEHLTSQAERAARDIDRLENQLRLQEKGENPHLDQIKSKQQALLDCKDKQLAKKKEIARSLVTLCQLEASKVVFSPKGVRNHILTAVTPFLNERTAHYLGTLSDGHIVANWQTMDITKKGEVRDKFVITATNDLGSENFAALSGGEKRKVRLATALALQDLVSTRATKNIELFIGDEIDDALDNSGLERLMGILTEKARERGTVMIISHRELKSWISEVMTVIKKDGFTTIEQE